MAVFVGKDAAIRIASGTGIAFTNEATTANAARTEYAINDPNKRHWDRTATFTVKRSTDNGTTWVTVPASEYTLIHAAGVVRFVQPQAAGTLVQVSGKYLPASDLGQAKEWSLDLALETEETTTFGSGWQTFKGTLRNASASLSQWWLDSFFLDNLASPMVLILKVDATRSYEAYAHLTGDSISVAANGLVEESLDFQIDGDVYFRG